MSNFVRFCWKNLVWLPLLWLSLGQGQLLAQVATPMMDPSTPTQSPSALSWRFGSTLATGALYGNQKGDEAEIKNRLVDSYGLFAYQPSNFSLEYYANGGDKTQWYSSYYDMFVPAKSNTKRLSMAVRGEGRVSVGLGFNSYDLELLTYQNKISSYSGSFSLRILDSIFLGMGLERMSSTNNQTENTLRWNHVLAGLALQFGDPLKSFFRMEVSGAKSPLVKASDEPFDQRAEHILTQGALEFKLGWLGVSYLGQRSETVNSYGGDNYIYLNHRYGLFLRGDSLAMGLYRHKGEAKDPTKFDKANNIELTFSYNFI